jgi:hypothetical protein
MAGALPPAIGRCQQLASARARFRELLQAFL